MAAIATLEFDIKHGVVDTDGLDDSVLNALNSGIELYRRRKYSAGAALLLPLMHFDWTWGQCDRDAAEVIALPEDLHIQCDRKNCLLRAGKSDGYLILEASSRFKVTVRDGVDEGELESWLDTNAAWTCGTISGGWGYLHTITNLYVTGFRHMSPRRRKLAHPEN